MKLETATVALEALRDLARAERRKLDPHSEEWAEQWARADALTLALDIVDAVTP